PVDVMANLFGYGYVDDFLKMVGAVHDGYQNSRLDTRRNIFRLPRPVAPYDADPAQAVRHCFDRETGEPVPLERLRTYAQALAGYHLHPEDKFAGGDCTDVGMTRRRHVRLERVEHIGKEADRWEEQFYLGADPDAQIEYGPDPDDRSRAAGSVLRACREYGVRIVAAKAGLTHGALSRGLRGRTKLSSATLVRLSHAGAAMADERRMWDERTLTVLSALRERCRTTGLRQVAREAHIDHATLSHVLAGRRKASHSLIRNLQAHLDA
ncbi:MAG TPA: hypothetical protein VKX16_00030, partial [Chloroflexota bacterium]|nr:hypothetical protein [Chloroflexota bacterium]